MANKKIGKLLRIYREAALLTQLQVADSLHINRTTYTYYEVGKTEPSIDTLAKLIKLFNITYEDLLPSESNPKDIKEAYNKENFNEPIYNLNNEEQNIVLKYRTASKEQKEKVKEILS